MTGSVKEAIEELKKGKLILVTDDEDRENEGDLICAAEFATTENVNFMASKARGLICMPMSAEIADKLKFSPMVPSNNSFISLSYSSVNGMEWFSLYSVCVCFCVCSISSGVISAKSTLNSSFVILFLLFLIILFLFWL